MFPLKDSIQSQSFPFINYLLIITNILTFLHFNHYDANVSLVYLDYGVVSQKVFLPLSSISVFDRFYPLFTYMFLHAGWFHLISNMYFLFIFGDNVEDKFGHVRYLMMYVLFGIASALTQVAFFTDSPYPLVGASGAVAGVMGAYLVFYPKAKVKSLVFIIIFITIVDIPAVVFLGIWFFIQFVQGTAQAMMGVTGGGTAWWAHIGGFVLGVGIAVYYLTKQKRK